MSRWKPYFKPATRLALLACLALLPLSSVGCAPHSDFMREAATPSARHAPVGQALVVFIRPSEYAFLARYQVIDGEGHFLGDALAHTHFAVTLPPGEHVFIAYADNDSVSRSDAMRANLAPGRVYFVELAPKMTGIDILAITPRSETWADVTTWLADTQELVPNRVAGQAALNEHPDDLHDEIDAGKKHLAEQNAEDLGDRTIVPGDGVE